jgi:hypothetical protein
MACNCNLYPDMAACGCKSTKKINPPKTSFCTNSQYDCVPNSKTFYTDCGGFNVGCKVYDLVSGKYNIVPDGFYSDGVYGYYISNGVVQATPSETCPRFFLVDYIKDCLNKDNLSGTWYVTVVDDNTWVPDTNVLYRIPIPLDQSTDCVAAYRSYWAVRFANTTPVYNIGNANYVEALVNDMNIEYNLPGFLQDRCSTKEKVQSSRLVINMKQGLDTKAQETYQVYISKDNGATYTPLTDAMNNLNCLTWQYLYYPIGTQIGIKIKRYGTASNYVQFNVAESDNCPANSGVYCEYFMTLTDLVEFVAITVYCQQWDNGYQPCPIPPPAPN